MAALLRHRGVSDTIASGVALVVASVLFGVYHVAHSPPFNTPEMVGLLTLVSEGAGLFYFVGHSLYGELVFHNFLAPFGVTTALVEPGQIRAFHEPVVALLAMALVALLALVEIEQAGVRRAVPPKSGIAGTQ